MTYIYEQIIDKIFYIFNYYLINFIYFYILVSYC